MPWLTWTLYYMYDFFSQDVARHNAATAAGRLMDERQQQADVEVYLAQRLDRQAPEVVAGGGKGLAHSWH
jgi:hypothetical protein